MSTFNNRHTLAHYKGSIWLSKPDIALQAKGQAQGIRVCVQNGDVFTAVAYLELGADGTYYQNQKPLGQMQDEGFRQYMEKLAKTAPQNPQEVADEVCRYYLQTHSIAKTAQHLNLPEGRVKRMLIAKQLYTTPTIEKVLWLYDEGRGHSVADIADMLKISEDAVRACLPWKD